MNSSFSIVDLLRHADPVVQSIVLVLVLCSVLCWIIIIEKIIRLAGLGREVKLLQRLAATGGQDPQEFSGAAKRVMKAGIGERADLAGRSPPDEARRRIEEAMRAAMLAELHQLEGGLTFLATIGSAAPFIGLFGTVWGIMTSFSSIAQTQDTSLAVVAPGIAEALFATATGLAAAIPAVVAFNQISAALGRMAQKSAAATPAIAKALARQGAGDAPDTR